MSYCRFWWDGSDVYVFDHVDGKITCCGCIMGPQDFKCDSPPEMIEHLKEHRAAGHHVPEYALEALREEGGLPLEHEGEDFLTAQIEWMEKQESKGMQAYAKILRELKEKTP